MLTNTMPRHSVSNKAWLEEKQENFLLFLLELCDKYGESTKKELIDQFRDRITTIQEDDTQKAIIFSSLARKQMVENIPLMFHATKACKAYWGKSKEDKLVDFDVGLEFLGELHKMLGDYIETIKTNKETYQPDFERFTGYISLFFGDFI